MSGLDGFSVVEINDKRLCRCEDQKVRKREENDPTVCVHKRYVIFNSTCVHELQKARYLRFLVSEDGTKFAFQVCDDPMEGFSFISERRMKTTNGKIYAHRVSRVDLTAQIGNLIQADFDNHWYKFKGESDGDGTVIFSISPDMWEARDNSISTKEEN